MAAGDVGVQIPVAASSRERPSSSKVSTAWQARLRSRSVPCSERSKRPPDCSPIKPHDPLTGLPNRRAFETALEAAWPVLAGPRIMARCASSTSTTSRMERCLRPCRRRCAVACGRYAARSATAGAGCGLPYRRRRVRTDPAWLFARGFKAHRRQPATRPRLDAVRMEGDAVSHWRKPRAGAHR